MKNLQAHRRLSGDDVDVIKRMHEDAAVFALQACGFDLRVAVGIAGQRYFHEGAAEAMHGVDFHLRRGHRHHDGGLDTQLGRRQRNALRVITGGRGDHPTGALRGVQLYHAVICTAQFEREHGLLIFALQPDIATGSRRQ